MTILWGIIVSVVSFLVLLSTIYGVISLFVDPRTLFRKLLEIRKKKKEYEASIKFLQLQDYFYCNIVQLGGEYSWVHSMQTYCNEEGGYYLNPPDKFVWVGMNRAGMTVITPSSLTREAGFKIASIGKNQNDQKPTTSEDILHLPTPDLRNQWLIKFTRKNPTAS